ncbi:MAG: hypothetical protein QXZ44_07250, partial [Ferroplasma sp.]
GWVNGIEPGGIKTLTGLYSETEKFTINFAKEQCSGYNEESGTDLACPKNPFIVKSAVMALNENVKPLFNDKIDIYDPCNELMQNPENTPEYYSKLIKCMMEAYTGNQEI